MIRTPEIMVTIGPTLEQPADLRRAIEAGARWFRLPCGYRQRPHVENARAIRAAAEACGQQVQLLLDLPSSRPRTGKMNEIPPTPGVRVRFFDVAADPPAAPEADVTSVPLPGLTSLLGKIDRGHRLWFCDGRLEFLIDEVGSDSLLARLDRGVVPLKASNSIYLPDSPSPFTMVTDDDRRLLEGFAQAGITPDWIAFSLVSTVADVEAGRREVHKCFPGGVQVMTKIETAQAVEDAEALLAASDGIMVARGDLGPAVGFVRLPEAQERLVAAARRANKIVVVATQVLEYFADVGVPLRSELSGLSLLALQEPDVVMLGKETVYSARPIESIILARDVLAYETRRREQSLSRLPLSLKASLGAPFVVAIEGPNGIGKTTLCTRLSERFGWPLLRGVPGDWEKAAIKLHMIRDADWLASALYFLSGVIESSREAVQGEAPVCLMDRSLWSTLAVHYAHDPSRLARLLPLVDLLADRFKTPDLTIVLEASAAACARRTARKDRHERELDAASPAHEGFQSREREFYQWLAEQWPRVVFVDAEQNDPEAVFNQAAKLIQESLPCCTC